MCFVCGCVLQVLNSNGTYDVPLACAQEGCCPRQMGASPPLSTLHLLVCSQLSQPSQADSAFDPATPRRPGSLGKFSQYNPVVDLAFAEWSMRTAAGWAKTLGVDEEMQDEFLHKAAKLSPYPLTVDPSFDNRTVWSEAKVSEE